MAIMKKNEIKSLNKQELIERIKQLEFEILKSRSRGTGQATTGTKRIKEIKKTIARAHAQLKSLE